MHRLSSPLDLVNYVEVDGHWPEPLEKVIRKLKGDKAAQKMALLPTVAMQKLVKPIADTPVGRAIIRAVSKYGANCALGAIQGAVLASAGGVTALGGAMVGCAVSVGIQTAKAQGGRVGTAGQFAEIGWAAVDIRKAIFKATGMKKSMNLDDAIKEYKKSMKLIDERAARLAAKRVADRKQRLAAMQT